MCGIFANIGAKNAAEICLLSLKNLEYRGYDSSGLAGIVNGEFYSLKELGKISALESSFSKNPQRLDVAIAHTRWATHGIPSRENAHPHFDQDRQVAVVHNGIIENHQELRTLLESAGRVFYSDTDTEVIAQLIAHLYQGDPLKAFSQALTMMKGLWGLAVIHKNHPDQILAAARANPIAIAYDQKKKSAYISSDANAFPSGDLEILFLNDGDIARVKSDHIAIFDPSLQPVIRKRESLKQTLGFNSKEGFEHFMLKEIFEQPSTLVQAMEGRLDREFGTVFFEELSFSHQELQAVRHILILACGTSWHAGLIARSLLEEKARIPTSVEIASEFRYRNPLISENTLVIAISQSGETLDTLSAIREAKAKGAKILSICNIPNSTLTRESHSTLFLKAGPEISVCSTKAFTSQICVLTLFTLLMARLRHVDKVEGEQFIAELLHLPTYIQQILNQKDLIKQLSQKYAHFEHCFFLGRHYMYPTSLEAALKLKEISYLNAVGYAAGEMKHGAIALLNPSFPVIALCGNKRTFDKMLSNLREVKARSAPLLAFANEKSPDVAKIADDLFWLPQTLDEFAPITYSVATQLFAYFIAQERGCEIDQPRNLAKSVTVE